MQKINLGGAFKMIFLFIYLSSIALAEGRNKIDYLELVKPYLGSEYKEDVVLKEKNVGLSCKNSIRLRPLGNRRFELSQKKKDLQRQVIARELTCSEMISSDPKLIKQACVDKDGFQVMKATAKEVTVNGEGGPYKTTRTQLEVDTDSTDINELTYCTPDIFTTEGLPKREKRKFKLTCQSDSKADGSYDLDATITAQALSDGPIFSDRYTDRFYFFLTDAEMHARIQDRQTSKIIYNQKIRFAASHDNPGFVGGSSAEVDYRASRGHHGLDFDKARMWFEDKPSARDSDFGATLFLGSSGSNIQVKQHLFKNVECQIKVAQEK